MSVTTSSYFFPRTHLVGIQHNPCPFSDQLLNILPYPPLVLFTLVVQRGPQRFYCILRACWPIRVHLEVSPYQTRATLVACPLCCTGEAAAGTPMLYFPDQQLVTSLERNSGLCFHSWPWGQEGGKSWV